MADEAKKKAFDFSLLSRVFHFVKPYRRFFVLSLLLSIVLAVLAPVRPYPITLTVDAATGKAFHTPRALRNIHYGAK